MNVGFGEIVTLVVLALLIFGPERLPGMAKSAGEMIGRLKREASGTLDELKRAAELNELNDVAADLKGVRGDLRAIAGDLRSDVDLRAAKSPLPAGPPPFDPEAT